jgi:hypothetical protein
MINSDMELSQEELVMEKLNDANTPGSIVEFDPDEAEMAGCFIETALSEEDAWDSVGYPDTLEE